MYDVSTVRALPPSITYSNVLLCFCDLAGYHLPSSKSCTRNLCESCEAARGHVSPSRVRGPRRGFENGHRLGAPVVVLRSSGVLARCCARARRVTPNGPLDGPKTYKLPADKGPLCLVPERRAAQQNFWPAACGELQATAKPRTVGRVSSGHFARSLRRSRVRAQYRAHGPRPQVVAAGV